jgi:hypothetical protein
MASVLGTGHRRRGSGISGDNIAELERAIALAKYKNRSVYVDSSATAGGNGDSWGGAYTTLVAALAAALVDDTIYVAPGHTENITAAGTITVSKAGVTIIGVGSGRRRPTFTWTATAGTWLVTAANVTMSNLVFIGTGIDAVVTMFNITADDCEFNNCEFDFARTSFVCLLGITITGAINRFKFFDNYAHGAAAANCTNFIQLAGGGDSHQFIGNTIVGNFTTTLGCINNITTLNSNITIRDNALFNRTASSTKVVVLLTGSTGIIANNRCGVLSAAVCFTSDACVWSGNWVASVAATVSTLC